MSQWKQPRGTSEPRPSLACIELKRHQTVAEALSHNVHSAGVVLNILARHHEPAPPLTITTPEALRLFHLISKLYERTSIIVTTNLAFGEWLSVFGEAQPRDLL